MISGGHKGVGGAGPSTTPNTSNSHINVFEVYLRKFYGIGFEPCKSLECIKIHKLSMCEKKFH